MARVMLIGGRTHDVELTFDDNEGTPIATCTNEDCPWREEYDDLRDAMECASDHVDLS